MQDLVGSLRSDLEIGRLEDEQIDVPAVDLRKEPFGIDIVRLPLRPAGLRHDPMQAWWSTLWPVCGPVNPGHSSVTSRRRADPAVSWAVPPRAGDGDRTRIISLGIGPRTGRLELYRLVGLPDAAWCDQVATASMARTARNLPPQPPSPVGVWSGAVRLRGVAGHDFEDFGRDERAVGSGTKALQVSEVSEVALGDDGAQEAGGSL